MSWMSISIDTSGDDGRVWQQLVGRNLTERADGRILAGLDVLGLQLSTQRTSLIFDFHATSNGPGAYVDPSSITETSAANYSAMMTKGRHEAIKTFAGNQPRHIGFTANFIAYGNPGRSRSESVAREVVAPALWLDALKYPFIGLQRQPYPPPPVILRIANILEMRARAQHVSVRWKEGWENGLPMAADVDLAFMSTPVGFSTSYTGLRRNYSYDRGRL